MISLFAYHLPLASVQIQSQACLQVMDEAEKEYKKMSDRINENIEVMKVSYHYKHEFTLFIIILKFLLHLMILLPIFQASYAEFITEAQASASRGKSIERHFPFFFHF